MREFFCTILGKISPSEMKVLKWIGFLFLGIILFMGMIFGIVFYATKDIPPLMDRLFETLKKGNFQEVYTEMTNEEFRKATTLQEFETTVKDFSLDSVKNTSWINEREISYNGRIESKMSGEITTAKGSFHIVTTFVRENSEWKLEYLSVIGKDIAISAGIKISLPSAEEQKTIVKNTILLFLEDIEGKKSFSKTYNAIATMWKNQITEEEFSKIFSTFLKTPLTSEDFQESTLYISNISMNEENLLSIEGTVQVKENTRLHFSLVYLQQNAIWKPIEIYMKILK